MPEGTFGAGFSGSTDVRRWRLRRQVFGFVEVDDRALRVAVALAGVFQFPREGNVSQNLAAEVVFSGPHGQRFGIERRGDPVGARGVHPEYVTRVPACHDGRCGVERHGGDEALGRALLEAFAQRRGHQIAGRTVADAGVAVDAHRGAVLDEFHDVVVHVIDPPLGDDAVYRRVGSRGERGERNGGRGMQVVVMALGIEGAAAYEPQESLVGEVVGVAVQVFARIELTTICTTSRGGSAAVVRSVADRARKGRK